ncbi:NAD(P)/FAD-dependent oxidoreductase [Paucihalobacter ruber]|uniref:NAD(P)/FAD-dependent oxidoreductase n=1 Tax=Paucihalobacter ruber TaxID=2567861 RepID=A0A506PEM5_9FLAO|nr:NAD(P)/FAD-dependent oxidoreductase [Paucihalobacter ruber]TPV32029.1 NAD(P)/FAD-dependent oxidoreductase [Paucihalobacter ruber]
MDYYNVIIIGGGAAGFFAAINIAEKHPHLKVSILERGSEGLQKVKISGGGRCNVTHAEFIPQELVKNYPRGEKELLGPFHQFMTGDTIEWFEKRGIPLKIEEDGRMFPETDSSKTIVDFFLNEAERLGVKVLYNQSVVGFEENETLWKISTKKDVFTCEKLIIATGSNPKIWNLLEQLGHTIVKPVPSLFTFNIKDKRIQDIPGVSVPHVQVKVLDSKLTSEGALLVTHWGLSAPAILKLSAFGALELAECNYQFKIEINFISIGYDECLTLLKNFKLTEAKKQVGKYSRFELPKRLWQNLVKASQISENKTWADLNLEQLEALATQLTKALFEVNGKSTFKEEFVTAGGVDLKEVNFKTFESKLHNHLYLAGEVLNIDAVTGGFNFQNCWTSAFILSKNI